MIGITTDLYPEQFHNHHMHQDKPEGIRYLDVDDIPDSWHKLHESVNTEQPQPEK